MKCACCGFERQGSGFRFYVYGVGYCDGCYPAVSRGNSWPIGKGWWPTVDIMVNGKAIRV